MSLRRLVSVDISDPSFFFSGFASVFHVRYGI